MEKGSEAPDCGDYLLAGEGYSHTFVLWASDKTHRHFGSFAGGFDDRRIVQMVGRPRKFVLCVSCSCTGTWSPSPASECALSMSSWSTEEIYASKYARWWQTVDEEVEETHSPMTWLFTATFRLFVSISMYFRVKCVVVLNFVTKCLPAEW